MAQKRKRWVLPVLIAVAVLVLVYVGVLWYAVRLLRVFPKATQAEAEAESWEWFMDARHTPEAMGFKGYEEVRFVSDGLQLAGWWFPATDTTTHQTLVLVHGRWSNRYRFISPLEVVKIAGLRPEVNLFIPDLRNSGVSEDAPVGLGQLFARDIEHALAYLHAEKGQDEFVLWGQSQGAMACMVYAARPVHVAAREQAGIALKGLFLESPLANVTANTLDKGQKDGYPAWFVQYALDTYDDWYGEDFLDSMDVSTLLPRVQVPVQVLQTVVDSTTPSPILKAELQELGLPLPPNLDVQWFEEGSHARICFPERNRLSMAALLRNLTRRSFGLNPSRPVPEAAAPAAPAGS